MCGDIMQILIDTIEFIKTLSYVDIAFFLAVVALMLLVITLIYFIKENSGEEAIINEFESHQENFEQQEEANDAIIDLREITKSLEERDTSAIDLNKYESEQEEKAIISYDELLKRKNDFTINYSEEEKVDEDLSIKKVDLDNLINKEVTEKNDLKVTVISYEKEEAFLEALKVLQQNLN